VIRQAPGTVLEARFHLVQGVYPHPDRPRYWESSNARRPRYSDLNIAPALDTLHPAVLMLWMSGSSVGQLTEIRPMNPSGIVVRTWNDAPISRRDSDGFANATAMCQANGKLWGNYHRLDTTTAYIKALGDSLGIPSDQLVISTKGGPSHLQGTWIHPRLAVDLARWLSPEFAVWMDGWFLEQAEAQHHQPQGLTTEQVLQLIQDAMPTAGRPPAHHLPTGDISELMSSIQRTAARLARPVRWKEASIHLSRRQRELFTSDHFEVAICKLQASGQGFVGHGVRGALTYSTCAPRQRVAHATTVDEAILAVLSAARTNSTGRMTRAQLLSEVSCTYGYGRETIDNALCRMVAARAVHRFSQGLYALYPWSEVIDAWDVRESFSSLRQQVAGLGQALDNLGQAIEPTQRLLSDQPQLKLLP
jgi:hypothetical protein